MLSFAMDCWVLGLALAVVNLHGTFYGSVWGYSKKILKLSAKYCFLFLALTNWTFSVFILWSMWE